MTTVAVRSLADEVWGILEALVGVNVYRGEIPQSDDPQVPIPPLDPDGRVHPYLVVYFGGGHASSNRVCATPNTTGWNFQVSCAGGDDNRALWCVDQVRAALTGTRVAGGVLRETIEGPDLIQRTDGPPPSRCWVPVAYSLYVCG